MLHSILLRACILLNVSAAGASAQFTTRFDRSFTTPEGTPYTGIDRCVARSDGGFHAVLQRYVLQSNNYYVDRSYLLRLDAQAQVMWSIPVSSTGDRVQLAVDAADNAFIAVGMPARVESYASDSSLRWSTTIPGSGTPVQDAGFGVTTAGTTVVLHWDDGTHLKTAALDANGVLIHDVASLPVPASSLFRVSVRPDGTAAGTTRTEMFLIRADGTLAWTVPHDFFMTYRAVGGPAGEVAAVGMNTTGNGIVTVRSATGSLLWTHTMPGPLRQSWWAADFDPWGGLVVAGEQNDVYWHTVDALVASFDATGSLRWSRLYDGPAGVSDRHYEVHADRSGSVFTAGQSSTNQGSHLIVSSWSRDGDLSWLRFDTGPEAEFPSVILESGSGEVVVGGTGRRLNLNSPPDNPYYDPNGFLLGLRPLFRTICLGDGVDVACPCGNVSGPGAREGCANSSGRGARLTASGQPRLTADTLLLSLEGSTPSAPGVYFQGSIAAPAFGFGDGLRCAGGAVRRIYTRTAQAGASSAPSAGDPSVSARSAATGDVIGAGSSRVYQVMYRDVAPAFCPAPVGALHNLSSGVIVTWLL